MRFFYVVCSFITLTLFAVLQIIAQDQNRNVLTEREQFREAEIERYKSMMQSNAESTTSDTSIDVVYYGLNVRVTTAPQYLRGSVLIEAVSQQDNLDSIRLDLMSAMTVDSVIVNGTLVGFLRNSSSFNVALDHLYALGEAMSITVYYQGVPGSSGFGSFEFSAHGSPSVPWVWTLSEPYGAKDWWPCKDHPSDKADSADIVATVDSSFKVGSNGRLAAVTNNGDGTVTYHWHESYPITTYLISLAITNYTSFSNYFHYSPTDSMEVLNYVLPEHLTGAQAGIPHTVDGLQIFSNLFGLYPFINEKYGHSEFGWGGAMEHQTMTSTTSFGEIILIHELSHQWFGDMITCRTWPNIWLNEGFATYCEALYSEQQYGASAYWSQVNGDMSAAKNAVGTVYVTDTSSVGHLFDGNLVYSKGGVVLHMLRHVLGDSVFFHAMYNYANDPSLKYGTATTRDFQHVCETTSGTDLNYFFNEWIFGEKYPQYYFNWSSASSPTIGYDVTISVGQTTGTSNPSFFTMPIDFQLSATGWDTTVTLFNDSAAQTFVVNVSHDPSTVQLDPEGWILKSFAKPISIAPSTIAFGPVWIGTERWDSLVVTNNGATVLVIDSATTDNADVFVTPVSATIPPAASQKFYVSFAPTSSYGLLSTVSFYYYSPSSPALATVTGVGITPTVNTYVTRRWNLVSVPLVPTDPRKTSIFPTAISSAFRYDSTGQYIPTDTLWNGVGYWLKFDHDQTVTTTGFVRYSDTIDAHSGWNLIGTLNYPTMENTVQSIPPGIITSKFFGYDNVYRFADTLEPGEGYWVKTSEPGQLILSSTPTEQSTIAKDDDLDELDKLVVRDATGVSQTLYFGTVTDGVSLDRYLLPPLPPGDGFDVRFQSGRMLEAVLDGTTSDFSISITAAAYPITVNWSKSSYASHTPPTSVAATIQAGAQAFPLDSDTGTITLAEAPSDLVLHVHSASMHPARFALEQNYPNPFNPTTNFRYQIATGGWVTLKVYDVLGREITTLVNEAKQPGVYSTRWDANDVPSGIYFYRLIAGTNFNETRKMLLLR